MSEDENKNGLIDVSNWELDTTSKFKFIRNLAQLGNILANENYHKHTHMTTTVHAISRLVFNNSEIDPVLDIYFFEVNTPFRNNHICKYALYEVLRDWIHVKNLRVKTISISPESDPFYLSIGLKREKGSINHFYGDESWLHNFIQSIDNEDIKSIREEILTIRNRICDEALKQLS